MYVYLCVHCTYMCLCVHSIIFSFSFGVYSNPSIQGLHLPPYASDIPTSGPLDLLAGLLSNPMRTGISQQTH